MITIVGFDPREEVISSSIALIAHNFNIHILDLH